MREPFFPGDGYGALHNGRMAVKPRRPRPPSGLDPAGKALWSAVLGHYELSPGEQAILGQACRVADVLERLDGDVRAAELTVAGSMGQLRPHPLLAASAEQRKVFDMLVRSLALPMPGEKEGHVRSPQQASAARQRWQGQRRAHGNSA
jgi:hypothetical protein